MFGAVPLLTPLRRIPLADACQWGQAIRVLEPEPCDGNVSVLELVVLNHLIRQMAPRALFEFGTFDGRTTLNMAANAPPDARVYTIDLPPAALGGTRWSLVSEERKYADRDAPPGERFSGTKEAKRIVQLLADTADFDFSPWYGSVDFVFIDASHAADYVRNDTDRALRLIGGRSGLVLWHDYGVWSDVTAVLEELRTMDPRLQHIANVAGTSLTLWSSAPA